MNVLVTGGAGYIGSIVTEELLNNDLMVVVFDNLQQGHKDAISSEAIFILADICNVQALNDVFRRYKIDAVMHMAAETVIGHSMTDPAKFFQNNIIGGINLLDTMLKHNVKKIIFSSSAAVYGEPETIPIAENHNKAPLNSYGESKLMFERILSWYGRAYGLKYISLRYFNAAGASQHLGENHNPETHLIPNVLKVALNNDSSVAVFGTDYPTKDGSCIRDYVHVVDIAQAHILALKKLDDLSGQVYNLGNENGYSVLEVIEASRRITGKDIATTVYPKRSGDPAVLVASSDKARNELNWKPRFTQLETIIDSAWEWLKTNKIQYTE